MKYIPLVHRVGAVKITRIEETTFDLAPDVLFPDWDENYSHSLEERFNTTSLDLGRKRVPLQTHLWIVEVDGLTVVIDTGIGNGKLRPFNKLFDLLDNPLLQRFQDAGFKRKQVDYVLLTHLHVDHVGWNTCWKEGRWIPVFPNATYIFSEKERDYYGTPAGAARQIIFEDSVLPIIKAGISCTVPDEGGEVLDGIRFLPTPGHSIGHMAIEVRSLGNTAVFSGDVMHSPLQVYHPGWNSMFCFDRKLAQSSREWLLAYAAENCATVLAAHFPESSVGRIQLGRHGYEWSYISGCQ